MTKTPYPLELAPVDTTQNEIPREEWFLVVVDYGWPYPHIVRWHKNLASPDYIVKQAKKAVAKSCFIYDNKDLRILKAEIFDDKANSN